jgi:thiamine transport system permease protein
LRLCGNSFSRIRSGYSAAAASLGASSIQTVLTVVLPLASPASASAALLIFLYCFTSFAVVLVLGGSSAATTLAVEIYRYARIRVDFRSAAVLSLAETVICAVVFALYLFFQKKSQKVEAEITLRYIPSTPKTSNAAFCACYVLFMCLFVLGPLISVPIDSFLFGASRASRLGFSIRHWQEIGGAVPALFRSLVLAAASAGFSCALALIATFALGCKKNGFLRIFTTAPLASSGIVLGLGYLLLYGRATHSFMLNFALLTALHGVLALPFAFNAIYGGISAIPATLKNAAATQGASPFRRFCTVEIPLSASQIRAAWGFSAALSMGELNAVLMLGIKNWETLPIYIYRATASYRFGVASAAGTLLMAAVFAALLLSEVRD